MVPLQVVDTFLLDYHVGYALALAFAFLTLGGLAVRSLRIVAINAVVFGLVFAMTPASLVPRSFLFAGIALLFVGPMLFVISSK